LDGKIFFPLTGIPILKSARKMVEFAVALPEPLTVLIDMVKLLTIGSRTGIVPVPRSICDRDIITPFPY
jgi:hypothetical protein